MNESELCPESCRFTLSSCLSNPLILGPGTGGRRKCFRLHTWKKKTEKHVRDCERSLSLHLSQSCHLCAWKLPPLCRMYHLTCIHGNQKHEVRSSWALFHLRLFMCSNQVRMRKMKAQKTVMRIHTDFSRWKSVRHNVTVTTCLI